MAKRSKNKKQRVRMRNLGERGDRLADCTVLLVAAAMIICFPTNPTRKRGLSRSHALRGNALLATHCVAHWIGTSGDAERSDVGSHAERGNQDTGYGDPSLALRACRYCNCVGVISTIARAAD